MDNFQEPITLKEFVHRWRAVLQVNVPLTTKSTSEIRHDEFDCSNVTVPHVFDIVDDIVPSFLKDWKELDDRKIVKEHDRPKWYEKHIRLPDGFDFQTRGTLPIDNDDSERTVSLTDPTQTTSYHQELWKLFEDIPTADELDKSAVEGAQLPATLTACKQNSQRRSDAIALSRIRMNNRHDFVQQSSGSLVATLRWECWKQQPKPGSAPDASRMVLEFLGDQTLLDFHYAIIELLDDGLWNEVPTGSSGFFFINGVFYTAGMVDYVRPIQTWLRSGSAEEQRKRAAILGLADHCNTTIAAMADALLEDLQLQLGVRYAHVCHGDVESTAVLVDRRLTRRACVPYPVIHDVWTPTYIVPECEACRHCLATFVSSAACELTQGQRFLCKLCCKQLRIPEEQVQHFPVWKGQPGLSAAAYKDKYF